MKYLKIFFAVIVILLLTAFYLATAQASELPWHSISPSDYVADSSKKFTVYFYKDKELQRATIKHLTTESAYKTIAAVEARLEQCRRVYGECEVNITVRAVQ